MVFPVEGLLWLENLLVCNYCFLQRQQRKPMSGWHRLELAAVDLFDVQKDLYAVTLMEIYQPPQLTAIEMRRPKQVRIHLGIMWLSKIYTIDGKKIRCHISKHQKNEQEYKSTPSKPYQPKPNTASWSILD